MVPANNSKGAAFGSAFTVYPVPSCVGGRLSVHLQLGTSSHIGSVKSSVAFKNVVRTFEPTDNPS